MVNLVFHQVLLPHTPIHHYSTLTVYPYLYHRHLQFLIYLPFCICCFFVKFSTHLHLQLHLNRILLHICINSVSFHLIIFVYCFVCFFFFFQLLPLFFGKPSNYSTCSATLATHMPDFLSCIQGWINTTTNTIVSSSTVYF